MKIAASPLTKKVNNVFIHVRDYNLPVTSETGITLDDHTFDPDFKLQPSKHVLFNFYTNNIDDAYQYIKDKGIPIVREIERFDDFAYFNIQDVDGNILMICDG